MRDMLAAMTKCSAFGDVIHAPAAATASYYYPVEVGTS